MKIDHEDRCYRICICDGYVSVFLLLSSARSTQSIERPLCTVMPRGLALEENSEPGEVDTVLVCIWLHHHTPMDYFWSTLIVQTPGRHICIIYIYIYIERERERRYIHCICITLGYIMTVFACSMLVPSDRFLAPFVPIPYRFFW